MTFVQTLRDAGVSHASVPAAVAALFGLALWCIPLGLYIAGMALSMDGARTTGERALWTTNVVAHVVTGALVVVPLLAPDAALLFPMGQDSIGMPTEPSQTGAP